MMDETIKMTLPARFRWQAARIPDHPFLAFVGEKELTYGETAKRVESVMAFLEKAGIGKGDHVALLGNNSPHWVVVYLAITSVGAVAIPLLPDFHAGEIRKFLEHSGAKMLFVGKNLSSKVKDLPDTVSPVIVSLEDFSLLRGGAPSYDPEGRPAKEYEVDEEDLALIIYTSGTTGRSKGVMLTHRNIIFDGIKSKNVHPIGEEDVFLSILPLSHTYENTIGFIVPLLSGSVIYYLKKPPTPSVLLPALKKVRPTVMLTVPLIIEKIHKKQIVPAFEKSAFMKRLYSIPFFRKRLNRMAGKKLMKTFGGRLRFYGVGGAKLTESVEKFLLEARFPYAVGYGLTETSPLIAGFGPSNQRLQSTGPPIEGIEVKIHDPDPATGEGEIWVRGPNVMRGYYKEPEMTREVLSEDGWFRTGDLGVLDEDNYLYIKGRLKNVIIGPGGENIYPEDIESIINTLWYVDESLVLEEEGKLVALVRVNLEELEKKFNDLKEGATVFYEKNIDSIDSLLKDLKDHVNRNVNRFSRISEVKFQEEPFIRTATNKIKRFLYGEGKDREQKGSLS